MKKLFLWMAFATSLLPASFASDPHPVKKEFTSLKFTFGKKLMDAIRNWSGEMHVLTAHPDEPAIRSAEISEDVFPETTPRLVIRENTLLFEGISQRKEIDDWVKRSNSEHPGYDPEIHNFYGITPYSFILHLFVEADARIHVKLKDTEPFFIDLHDLQFGMAYSYLDELVSVHKVHPAMKVSTSPFENGQATYNDFPSISTAPDGTVYVGFVSFKEGEHERLNWAREKRAYDEVPDFADLSKPVGGDQVVIKTMTPSGRVLTEQLTDPGRDVYEIKTLIDHDYNVWVFWSERTGTNWNLFYRYKQKDKWSKPRRLTKGDHADIHPEVAVNNKDQIGIVYQRFTSEGSSIMLSTIDAKKKRPVIQELLISQSPSNEWEPSIGTLSSGAFAIAWDSYRNGNYDVFYTTVDTSGSVAPVMTVAGSPNYEANCSVVVDDLDRVWVAYEFGGANWGKDYGEEQIIDVSMSEGLNMGRSVRIKCIVNGELFTTGERIEKIIPKEAYEMNYYTKFLNPKRYERNSGPAHFLYWPTLIKLQDGKIGLVYRAHEPINGKIKNYTLLWSNYFTCFDGKRWSVPVFLSGSEGQLYQKPTAARKGGSILIAYTGDSRNHYPKDSVHRKMNISLASVHADGAGMDAVLVRSSDEARKDGSAEGLYKNEPEHLKNLKNYRLEIGKASYRIMSGDTHRHTSFSSDGGLDGSFYDLIRYSMDAANLDWANSADHDFGGATAYEWYLTQKLTDVFFVDKYFYTLFGYERSKNFPDGHRNVIFSRRGIRLLDRLKHPPLGDKPSPDTEMLYNYLHRYDGISIPHTPISAGTDWRDHDPEVEPVVEIYQGCRTSSEYINAPRNLGGKEVGTYWAALKKGHRLGVIASSDHHSSHVSYAMVYIENPSRENILDAIKKRHTYAATDNIVLDVRMNENMMGDELTTDGPVNINVKAIGTGRIASIEIIKNCSEIIHFPFDAADVELDWNDGKVESGLNYYYVRLIQENGEMAWSSPIWVNYKRPQSDLKR